MWKITWTECGAEQRKDTGACRLCCCIHELRGFRYKCRSQQTPLPGAVAKPAIACMSNSWLPVAPIQIKGKRACDVCNYIYIYTYAYVLVCMYIVKAPYDFADCSSGVFCLGLLSPRYSKPDKYLQCFPRYIALYALLLLSCDTKPIHLTPATDYYCFQFRVECLMTRLPKIPQKMPHSGQVSCRPPQSVSNK